MNNRRMMLTVALGAGLIYGPKEVASFEPPQLRQDESRHDNQRQQRAAERRARRNEKRARDARRHAAGQRGEE
ncbi:MAG: hypothetical protein ABN479_19775 [Billgrantia sp.]